jgi:hypothetical protein
MDEVNAESASGLRRATWASLEAELAAAVEPKAEAEAKHRQPQARPGSRRYCPARAALHREPPAVLHWGPRAELH